MTLKYTYFNQLQSVVKRKRLVRRLTYLVLVVLTVHVYSLHLMLPAVCLVYSCLPKYWMRASEASSSDSDTV